MNTELLIGIGLVVLGFGIVVFVAILREQQLAYLSGVVLAAMGGTFVAAGTMSLEPARVAVILLLWVVACLAIWFQARMARKLPRPAEGTPGQESGGS